MWIRRLSAESTEGRLWLPAFGGLLGSSCVLVGASQQDSPFTEHGTGAWWFVLGHAPALPRRLTGSEDARFLGVLCVYFGLLLLVASWYRLFALARERRRAAGEPSAFSIRALAGVLACWSLPIALAAPLFSRDAYSYAAQGLLVTRGLDPATTGAARLGPGLFLAHVDPLWRHAPAPYGAGWQRLVGAFVSASGHDLVGTLVLLRLTSLASLALVAWAVPAIARATGHDRTGAFVLGVMNPLVVVTLVGGMHNDGPMLALVAAGIALALRGHRLLGVLVCLAGAEVKLPALLAVVFIAWWAADDRLARRAPPATTAGLADRPGAVRFGVLTAYGVSSLAVLAVANELFGLGWAWVRASFTPGTVVSWLDPATALGLALEHVLDAVGLGGGAHLAVPAARAAALAAAGVIALVLLFGSSRARAGARAGRLGWAYLAVALLGPVVWPWYESWGIVLVATASSSLRTLARRFVLALSIAGVVADLPPGRVLVGGTPALVVAGWTALVALAAGVVSWEVAGRGRTRPGPGRPAAQEPRPSLSSAEP